MIDVNENGCLTTNVVMRPRLSNRMVIEQVRVDQVRMPNRVTRDISARARALAKWCPYDIVAFRPELCIHFGLHKLTNLVGQVHHAAPMRGTRTAWQE